jgi:pSer/pThr/pTyr-binding forkhead associated (FHA) protein
MEDRRDHDHGLDPDTTETIDPVAEARTTREREAAAGIPGLDGFAVIVASGARRGMHWSLPEGLTSAGRDPEAEIFLDDVTVSREHAVFHLEAGHLRVEDRGSTNGTYVNGRRTEGADLSPGDEVIIGRFHLVVARGG